MQHSRDQGIAALAVLIASMLASPPGAGGTPNAVDSTRGRGHLARSDAGGTPGLPGLASKSAPESTASAATPAPPEQTSPAAAAAAPFQAAGVAAKVLEAYGGLEKLKEVKSQPFRSHGRVTVTSGISGAANSFECDILGKGDRVRIETSVLGQPMVLGFDGKDSWTQFGDWVSKSTETTAKRIAEELRHGLDLLLKMSDPASKVTVTGKKTVQGRSCDVLQVTAEDGKPTTFYADEGTHLVVRSEYTGTDPEQGVPALQSVEYYDYRTVAGTQLPFKTIEYSSGKKTSETVLESQQFGVALDDKVFEMPPESEVARVKEGPVTLPFDYVANEIVVRARVNNKTDLKFILDTGASQSVLDKGIAGTFGPYSTANFSITAGAKAVPLSYTTLQAISLGDITLTNIPVLITDLSSFAKAMGERPAGLIGANILRRFLVTIDFRDKKVVLSDPNKVSVPKNAVIVPTSPSFGATALVVAGKLDGKHDFNFLVDTGAAFNNLPPSAAKPWLSGPVLPVGQVFGIDGQKVSIGAIRLKSLSLGSLSIKNPVFALAPESVAGGAGGLFAASSMGILGNPIWSRFRLTIDYRNERLMLERPPEFVALEELTDELSRVEMSLLRTKNIEAAIGSYEQIAGQAKAKGSRSGEALAIAYLAQAYLTKYKRTNDRQWLTLAVRKSEEAARLAAASRDDEMHARVLAGWAQVYMNAGSGPAELLSAQTLLTRAAAMAPADPHVCAALAALSFRAPALAPVSEKLVDQALMLDPSNWEALWLKYRMFQGQGNNSGQQQVAAQLRRYYPDVPEVVALAGARKPAPPARPPARAGR
ncbi:MAG TPA: aspartyl protease family protein [Candidatus Obscuribacterales bacterium]